MKVGRHVPSSGVPRVPKAAVSKILPPADFFISYTRVDKKWAELIAWWLEEMGFTVVIQAWDFRPGQNFMLMMQKGMSCKKMIAVLSDEYLAAVYTRLEWAAALAADPIGAQRKVIPIRVNKCQPQGVLATLIYIDFVDLNEAQCREELAAGIRDRGKPATKPPFPASIPYIKTAIKTSRRGKNV